MRSYIVNYLIAFLAVMATCHMAIGRSQPFFRTLDETAAEVVPKPIVDNNIDSVDGFPVAKTHTVSKVSAKRQRKPGKPFVSIKLENIYDGRITLEEGKSYVLTCKIMVNSSASVHWFDRESPIEKQVSLPSIPSSINTNRVVMAEEKYVINCATKKDEGQVYCAAVTTEQTIYKSVVIDVVDSTEIGSCSSESAPVITSHIDTMFSTIGSTINLKCIAHGLPKPQIRWTNERGNVISSNESGSRYAILDTGDLVISNLDFYDDMGRYICIATSIAGEDSADTFVYPTKAAEYGKENGGN